MIASLKEAGVTHLALETVNQQSLDEARASGVVEPSTEGFAFEPRRAALLRTALAAGLPVVAFDVAGEEVRWMQYHPQGSMAYREEAMARHIRERILEGQPGAKVLVWVGMGHAQQWSGFGGLKMMIDWLCEPHVRGRRIRAARAARQLSFASLDPRRPGPGTTDRLGAAAHGSAGDLTEGACRVRMAMAQRLRSSTPQRR